MTTPRIEEMVEEFEHKIMSVDELGHQAHIGDAYGAIQWLRTALTKAHQAGIDEAVEIVESKRRNPDKENTTFGEDAGWIAVGYNQALQDTIKALQDNK
jgi:GH35 family endo-1,4-beta-xylanase